MRPDVDDRQSQVLVLGRLGSVAADDRVEDFGIEGMETIRVLGQDRHMVEPVQQHPSLLSNREAKRDRRVASLSGR